MLIMPRVMTHTVLLRLSQTYSPTPPLVPLAPGAASATKSQYLTAPRRGSEKGDPENNNLKLLQQTKHNN